MMGVHEYVMVDKNGLKREIRCSDTAGFLEKVEININGHWHKVTNILQSDEVKQRISGTLSREVMTRPAHRSQLNPGCQVWVDYAMPKGQEAPPMNGFIAKEIHRMKKVKNPIVFLKDGKRLDPSKIDAVFDEAA